MDSDPDERSGLEAGDLWLLPQGLRTDALAVGLGAEAPLYVDDARAILPSVPFGELGPQNKTAISAIPDWRRANADVNVFRTLCVFDAESGDPLVAGPLYLDIDAVADDPGAIADAASATRALFNAAADMGCREEDIRIAFSGRKGFHLELRPEGVGTSCYVQSGTWEHWRETMLKLTNTARRVAGIASGDEWIVSSGGSRVDPYVGPHADYPRRPYFRLTDSRNLWRDEGGSIQRGRKVRVTPDELADVNLVLAKAAT